jgi:hypothetical protein
MFFQQWTGINAILYYAPKIFGGLGLSSNAVSLLATGVVGIAMFIVSTEYDKSFSLAENLTIITRRRFLQLCTSISSDENLCSLLVRSAWQAVT